MAIVTELIPPRPVLDSDQVAVVTGRSNPVLVREVARILGVQIEEPVTLFQDGESHVEIVRNLRRKEVYIIQSTGRNIQNPDIPVTANDNILELIFMIHAARRASAKEITVVIPYYGYARQDRKDKARVTISAADVANMIVGAGADRILTVDIHSEQQQGFTNIPWDNIYASSILLPEIMKHGKNDMVVASPDVGGTKRAENISNILGLHGNIATVHKKRPKANESEALEVIGDVEGKNVLLIDDIIDTAGTIVHAADLLKKPYGANKIVVVATHGLFTKPALDRIAASSIDSIYVTDTIAIPRYITEHPNITIISIASLLAESIRRIHTGESISELILTV